MGIKGSYIDLIHKAASGDRRYRAVLTPFGWLLAVGIFGLVIFLSLRLDRFLGIRRAFARPFRYVIGIPLLIIGSATSLWALLHFAKAKGTPVPYNPPPKLVTTGPYAHARNPMMTGLFAAMFGLATVIGSVSMAFIFTPLYVLINLLHFKRVEEPELERRLGEEYSEYKRRVPMIFPLPKKEKAGV